MFSSAAVDVTPSRIFSSAVVLVIPSSTFSSAVVTVAPSRISSSASVIVAAPMVNEVPMVGVLSVGDVRVLLVSVCVPVSVATVLSMAKVTALRAPLVSIPVPPVNVRVSESRSMLRAPPVSAWKSKSCAVTCESTYALTDCCVGTSVALFDAILSSSTNAVMLIVPSEIVSKVVVPVNVGPAMFALVATAV